MALCFSSFATIAELVDALSRCGANVREGRPIDATTVMLECERGNARLDVEVFKDAEGRPSGVWGRRDLIRRALIASDIALMHDLTSVIETQAGRPDESGASEGDFFEHVS
jgi:hypothetical protein